MKSHWIKNKKGFSLLELLVATFVFGVVMLSATMIFNSSFKGSKNAQAIQKNLEDAQLALNLVAKSLRTSTIVGTNDAATPPKNITVYDYSQGLCIRYAFENSALSFQSTSPGDLAGCVDDFNGGQVASQPIIKKLTNGYVSGYFTFEKSSVQIDPVPHKVGKVTISMTVCADAVCGAANAKNKTPIQTSVSLRDYSETGL